ncbi:methyltransferase [Sorangium sp. So ce726]|uniref:methyltransferase n=1 Tax=Sorangium sp. So ce726 TaxID=3133319 RepID=UPI003F608FBD
MSDAGMEASVTANRRRFNDILCGLWLARALSVTAALQIPDAVGDEPVSADALAARLQVDAASLHRLLRALAANGIFEEAGEQTFRHSEMSRQLRRDHPFSMHFMAVFMGSQLHNSAWDGFAGAIRDGRSGFLHHRGVPLYDHLRGDAADAALFNTAMMSYSLQTSAAIAGLPAFRAAGSVLDAGGGVGVLAAAIARAHPGVRAVVLDLPGVQAGAASYLAQSGAGERVTFQPGDFFEGVPAGHDVYVLKSILWNWNDERCLQILKNIRSAMGASRSARLLVIENVLLPSNQTWATLHDLQMLAIAASGRIRTGDEHRELARQASLQVESVTVVEDTTVVELSPS